MLLVWDIQGNIRVNFFDIVESPSDITGGNPSLKKVNCPNSKNDSERR